MIFAWLEKYAIVLLGGAIVACFVAIGAGRWSLLKERSSHAMDNAAYAGRVTQALQDKDAAEHSYREQLRKAKEDGDARQAEIDRLSKLVADAQATVVTAQGRLAAAQKRNADLAADNGKLRGDLAAYARGGSGDTASACEARAERFAEFVTRGFDLITTCGTELSACNTLAGKSGDLAKRGALDAANFGSQVNVCFEAWPKAPNQPAR